MNDRCVWRKYIHFYNVTQRDGLHKVNSFEYGQATGVSDWYMGLGVFLGAALWLGTFRGIVVPLPSASSRPAFSGSGRVIVIRLDAGLSTVFRNVGTTVPVTQHNIPTTRSCWAQVSNETACNSAAAVYLFASNLLSCTQSWLWRPREMFIALITSSLTHMFIFSHLLARRDLFWA